MCTLRSLLCWLTIHWTGTRPDYIFWKCLPVKQLCISMFSLQSFLKQLLLYIFLPYFFSIMVNRIIRKLKVYFSKRKSVFNSLADGQDSSVIFLVYNPWQLFIALLPWQWYTRVSHSRSFQLQQFCWYISWVTCFSYD